MRRILAFVLLLVLALPSAMPLFAAGQDDAGVPACCKRNGRHHCTMSNAGSETAAAKRGVAELRSSGGACPYRCELRTTAQPGHGLLPDGRLRLYAAVLSHSAQQAQTECRWRLARERARGKRGPPAWDRPAA